MLKNGPARDRHHALFGVNGVDLCYHVGDPIRLGPDVDVRDRHPFASGLFNGPLPSSRQSQRGLVVNPDGDPVVSLGVVVSSKDGFRFVGGTVVHDQNFG